MVKLAPYENLSYIAAGDMSTDVTGGWVMIPFGATVSVDMSWTGVDTPTGTFTVEVTNELDKSGVQTVTGSTTTVSGGPGSALWSRSDLAVRFLRVKYNQTSGGSGDTCTVGIMARAI